MHYSANRTRLAVALGSALLVSPGCQRGPVIVPAAGTILYRGQPLVGANVTFVPTVAKDALLAMAVTDQQGRFALETRITGKDTRIGAAPGDYRVSVSKYVPPNNFTEVEYQKEVEALHAAALRGEGSPAAPPKVELLPAEYSSSQDTQLTATVPSAGKSDFQFDLK